MKMKLFKPILLLVCLILSTSCAKVDFNMEIKKDKTMNLVVTAVVEESKIGDINNLITNKQIRQLEDNGFYVQKYTEDSKVGYQFTKTISNIDKVSSDFIIARKSSIEVLFDKSQPIFGLEENFLKNKYVCNFDFKNNSYYLGNVSNILDNSDITLEFSVKLPYGALSNNATTTSSNSRELSWDLTQADSIYFEFELYNSDNIFIIAIASLLIIFTIYFTFSKDSKNDKKKNKVYFNRNDESLKEADESDKSL